MKKNDTNTKSNSWDICVRGRRRYKMNQARKLEIWKEIISSCEEGDSSHSYRLFSETVDAASGERK